MPGYSIVQSAKGNGTTTATAVLGSNPTAGNLIFAWAGNGTKATPATWTLADNASPSNSLTEIASGTRSTVNRLSAFGVILPSTVGKTFTLTGVSGDTVGLLVYEVSGNPSILTGIVDAQATTLTWTSGTTKTGNNVTSTQNNEGLFSAVLLNASVGTAAPTVASAGVIQQEVASSSSYFLFDAFANEATVGTYHSDFTWASSTAGLEVSLVLKPPGAGGSSASWLF
jgi:hypothetical protein